MISRLIRWLTRAEIDRARMESERLLAQAYVSGYNSGRAVGQAEMLDHLRGEPEDRVTSDMARVSAKGMVH